MNKRNSILSCIRNTDCKNVIFILILYVSPFSQTVVKLLPPDSGIYHCAFPDFGPEEDIVNKKKIEEFIDLTGKKIVWAYFSNNWLHKKIEFPTDAAKAIHEAGVIPFIRVCPRNDWNSPSRNLNNPGYYSLKKIADGVFDDQIRIWARAAAQLRFPLCVEFGPEVNGDWFYWDGVHNNTGCSLLKKRKYTGPQLFVTAYRRFIDICRTEGATNITWFIHFDAGGANEGEHGGEWNAIKNYYPGDDYIDWIGISCYACFLPTETPVPLREIFTSKLYKELTALSNTKPIALLEFGCPKVMNALEQTAWTKQSFIDITEQKLWPRLKAISWWHSNFDYDSFEIMYRIDTYSHTLQAYKKAIANDSFIDVPTLSGEGRK